MNTLSATIHALSVDSPSVCQLINHPEANKKGERVNSASYKKCKELFLKDTSRLKSFPTLKMFKETTGNVVTYEVTNKPDERSKSGQKIVFFPNDKDRSCRDYSKRPKDDARKDGQDGRKYGTSLLDPTCHWRSDCHS